MSSLKKNNQESQMTTDSKNNPRNGASEMQHFYELKTSRPHNEGFQQCFPSKKKESSIKHLLFLFFIFFIFSSCDRNFFSSKKNISLFSPDTSLTVDKILEMGIERETGVDNDIFILQDGDTTIIIDYGMCSRYPIEYKWMIPIAENTEEKKYIKELEKNYGVVLINATSKIIKNPQNGLFFRYYVGPISSMDHYYPLKSTHYCIIWYYTDKRLKDS